MADENWWTHCDDGFGWRGIAEVEYNFSAHFDRHRNAYAALLRRYLAPSHPYLGFRDRVVWRRRDHIYAEPKANICLPPPLCARLLGGAEPPPGRVYFLLSLAEGTPGRIVRKVAANFILAEAGPGGSIEKVDRPIVEDMLLRVLSWPDDHPPYPGEWGLTSREGVAVDPSLEAARPLVSAVLAGGQRPASAGGWAWTLSSDAELGGAAEELPPLEKARHPAAFGAEVRIRLKERAVFPDGLEILYRSTSHKRTYEGSPSCAMPHLDLTRPGLTELIEPHWETQGRKGWGDTVTWEGYEIEVLGLDYDEEVRLRVSRR